MCIKNIKVACKIYPRLCFLEPYSTRCDVSKIVIVSNSRACVATVTNRTKETLTTNEQYFKPDKLNKSRLTESFLFTFSYHIFSTSYYLEILKKSLPLTFVQFFAFLVFLRLSPAILNISTFPPDFAKCEQVYLFFQPVRFFLKPDFTSSIVPRNISAICQKFCTFFPHYYLFFTIFLSEYCSLVVKFSFVLFFLEVLCWF